MGKLYFSLKGRINPADFQKSAITLIVISFILALLNLVSMSFALLSMPIGLVLAWMWLSLWSKRLHDAGKSAWMVLLVLLVSVGVGFVSTRLVYMITSFDQAAVTAAAQAAGTDIMGAMKASMEASKPIILPSAIASAISTFIIGEKDQLHHHRSSQSRSTISAHTLCAHVSSPRRAVANAARAGARSNSSASGLSGPSTRSLAHLPSGPASHA